jgi:hypothetical protein
MVVGASEILGYATEALLLAGDLVAAEAQLNEALAIAGDVNERVYLPQLYLMQAAIARAHGDRIVGDASLRRALDEAKSQQAPWLELMALNALCDSDLGNADIERHWRRSSIECEASDTDAIAKRERCSQSKHGGAQIPTERRRFADNCRGAALTCLACRARSGSHAQGYRAVCRGREDRAGSSLMIGGFMGVGSPTG